MPSPPTKSWRIAFSASATTHAAFAAALEEVCVAVSRFEIAPNEAWRIEGLSATPPDRAAIETRLTAVAVQLGVAWPQLDVAPLPDVDWLRENRRSFPPLRVGRFFVHGTHWKGRAPAGAVVINLDAGIAFGSGEHATTRGCLAAIDVLTRPGVAGRRRVRRARDLGCGSGILALALARAFRRRIAASDNDRDAVTTTRDNARRNGIARLVRTWPGDGLGRGPKTPAGLCPPYDLIAANILARSLCRMARDIAGALAPRGRLILSGLLAEQEAEVLAAYRLQRLRLRRRIAIDGWSILILAR